MLSVVIVYCVFFCLFVLFLILHGEPKRLLSTFGVQPCHDKNVLLKERKAKLWGRPALAWCAEQGLGT